MSTQVETVSPTMPPPMQLALEANFGSVARWQASFVALGQSLADGSGTVVLAFDPKHGCLVNDFLMGGTTIDPATPQNGTVTLLAIDPHAQAGPAPGNDDDKTRVTAFVQAIHWPDVYARYVDAVHAATAHLGATADEASTMGTVLDVRRAGVYNQAEHRLPNAQWRNPVDVATWGADCRADEPVLVYCVYGHEVGRVTALRLNAAGVQAKYLEGGIDAWQRAGRPLQPKP